MIYANPLNASWHHLGDTAVGSTNQLEVYDIFFETLSIIFNLNFSLES